MFTFWCHAFYPVSRLTLLGIGLHDVVIKAFFHHWRQQCAPEYDHPQHGFTGVNEEGPGHLMSSFARACSHSQRSLVRINCLHLCRLDWSAPMRYRGQHYLRHHRSHLGAASRSSVQALFSSTCPTGGFSIDLLVKVNVSFSGSFALMKLLEPVTVINVVFGCIIYIDPAFSVSFCYFVKLNSRVYYFGL